MTVDTHGPGPEKARWRLALLVAATFIIVVRAYNLPPDPLDMDGATYAAIARELRLGADLYVDVWDHKPPAIYATYAAAQGVFGYDIDHALALSILFPLLTLAAVYCAARLGSESEATPVIAAVLWAFLSATPTMEGQQPNTEIYINALHPLAFGLLLAGSLRRMRAGQAAVLGLLFALASMYKTTAAIVAVALGLTYLFIRSAGPLKLRVRNLGIMAAVATAAWVALFGYFGATGRFAHAWDAMITFNQDYAGSLGENLAAALNPAHVFPPLMIPAYPLLLAAAGGALLTDWRRPGTRTLLMAAWAGAVIVEIVLPGHWSYHYYLLWLPPLCIGGAWGLERLRARFGLRAFEMTGAALSMVVLLIQLPLLRMSPAEWSRWRSGHRVVYNQRVGALIDDWLPPNTTFFQWGHHAELYYYSGRRPPTPEFRAGHIFKGDRTLPRLKRLIERLYRAPPPLVVATGDWDFVYDRDPVSRWVLDRYEPVLSPPLGIRPGTSRLYVRRDAPLAERLLAGGAR